MVVALMIMLLLSVIGLAAYYLSSIEVQIAGNERTYQENFYLAESAALEGVQRLSNFIKSPLPNAVPWLNNLITPGDDGFEYIVAGDILEHWQSNNVNPEQSLVDDMEDSCFDDDDGDTIDRNPYSDIYFAAEYDGTPPGASLKTTNIYKEHGYEVYALYQSYTGTTEDAIVDGLAIIEIGFKR